MKIILYSDVPDLGEEGDVKTVADGYARNYLIPRKLAVRYTKTTEAELAQKQQAISRRKEEKKLLAAGDKTRIESLEMITTAPAGEKGRLFGSITSAVILNYLHSQDIVVERKRIEMPEAGIKTVGTHTVHIKLYGGERAELKITVTGEGDTSVKEKSESVKTRTETTESGSKEPASEKTENIVSGKNTTETKKIREEEASEELTGKTEEI